MFVAGESQVSLGCGLVPSSLYAAITFEPETAMETSFWLVMSGFPAPSVEGSLTRTLAGAARARRPTPLSDGVEPVDGASLPLRRIPRIRRMAVRAEPDSIWSRGDRYTIRTNRFCVILGVEADVGAALHASIPAMTATAAHAAAAGRTRPPRELTSWLPPRRADAPRRTRGFERAPRAWPRGPAGTAAGSTPGTLCLGNRRLPVAEGTRRAAARRPRRRRGGASPSPCRRCSKGERAPSWHGTARTPRECRCRPPPRATYRAPGRGSRRARRAAGPRGTSARAPRRT